LRPGRPAGIEVRDLAIRAILRVNELGAYSNVLLETELARGSLHGPNRGLFVQLVRGVLERQAALDWALGRFLSLPIERLDPPVREVLRLGAYQLLYTEVPAFAACDTSVHLARLRSGRGAAALANAVLRRLASSAASLPWPDRFSDPLGYLTIHESHPRWLAARWLARFGEEAALALCLANNAPPGVTIRTNLLLTTRQQLASDLAAEGITVTEGKWAPEALHVACHMDLHRLSAYRSGRFTIQDEASMLAARALAPREGETVIDACAAPGGKTTHLAAMAGDAARILAVDVNQAKLSQVQARARRMGLKSITVSEGDAKRLGELMPGRADALLLDAPCSGLGVIRRRPELKWRRKQEDLPKVSARQLELLRGVAPAVRKGGRLVYAVCSFEPEETEDVVAGFLASEPGAGWEPGGQPCTMLPHVHGTDGFYYALLNRGRT
jgi:16S rRNA (cytosine967-C5)-methyltransferase